MMVTRGPARTCTGRPSPPLMSGGLPWFLFLCDRFPSLLKGLKHKLHVEHFRPTPFHKSHLIDRSKTSCAAPCANGM